MKKIPLSHKFKASNTHVIFRSGLFLGLFLSVSFFSVSFAAKDDVLLQVPIGKTTVITPCTEGKDFLSCGGIGDYITIAYAWIIGAVGILSMVAFAYAGLLWLLSRGNSGQVQLAQKVLTDTIAGLVLTLCSYLILYIINPSLVNFPELIIGKIKPIEDEPHFQKKLSNITVHSNTITISIWDFGNVDNDKVRVIFNDNVLIETLTLKGPPGSTYILHLKPGANKFEIYAHNEGDPDKHSPTNTAKIKFTNVEVGLTEQGWGLKEGQTTSMIITAPGGTAPSPAEPEEAPIIIP